MDGTLKIHTGMIPRTVRAHAFLAAIVVGVLICLFLIYRWITWRS